MVHSLCLGVELLNQEDPVPMGVQGYKLAGSLEIRRWLPAA